MQLPRMIRVRQVFEPTPPVAIRDTLNAELPKLYSLIKPGARIAVGVGSRGITNLSEIVSEILVQLLAIGSKPFIIPAMGSHGGATPEGQLEVLASYGITEESMGVPIRASLKVKPVGLTEDMVTAYCSSEALAADGILLVNRIKPHTDFFGSLGSGLLKMCVIGLGKRTGATAMHLGATQFGYERVIRGMASVIIKTAPVIGGVAILENQFHDTAKIVVIPRDAMESAENDLLVEAKALMPLLPLDEIDLLIVDRIGKNISGAGLDPNVINRSIHGYNSLPMRGDHSAPFIRRIFVRGLTPETHGNAIGIGMADATTTRLVREMDTNKTNINSLTALTPQSSKIPIAFDTDREAIERMLMSLPMSDPQNARIVRIADTLSVADMEISEKLWSEIKLRENVIALNKLRGFLFDDEGNLN
ncbi:MAG: hypothetical protein NTW52_04190 [Planctomycetota bacterium]|nr:hypothetical protein [Planctomycetota bacterium]